MCTHAMLQSDQCEVSHDVAAQKDRQSLDGPYCVEEGDRVILET